MKGVHLTLSIITIVVIVVIATGFLFFVFNQPSTPFSSQQEGGKCPDGICDDYERMHPAACPQDCSETTSTQQTTITQSPSEQFDTISVKTTQSQY